MRYIVLYATLFFAASTSLIPPAAMVEKTGMVPDRLDIQVSLSANSSTTGRYVVYQNNGGYVWVDGKENPTWLPERPIIGDYGGNYLQVWFKNGYFVSSNGSRWGRPSRWFYIRAQEEVVKNGNWVLPDGTPPPILDTVTLRADNYQGIVDYLMNRVTVTGIQDMMDKSTGFFPKAGAPQ